MNTDVQARGERALAFAVSHVNVSARRAVTGKDLLRAVKCEDVPAHLQHHVYAFLDETEIGLLGDMASGGLVTYQDLASKARLLLPPEHETRQWLDERA